MVLIIGAALAAIGALVSYRRSHEVDSIATETTVRNLRQATSVLLAIGNAFWAIMDALQLISRPRAVAASSGGSLSIGRRVIDVDD